MGYNDSPEISFPSSDIFLVREHETLAYLEADRPKESIKSQINISIRARFLKNDAYSLHLYTPNCPSLPNMDNLYILKDT